jgi:glycosyltransferase involved in cell wall biosynthesis
VSFVPDLVSVVIPVYNGAKFLDTALGSVLAQTYQRLEVIAVNDGSTDNCASILAAYGDRVAVLNQKNQGCPGARQAGVDASRGEFIAFLDQDDVWRPTKIARQVEILKRYPDAVGVYCDHHSLSADGRSDGKPAAGLHPTYSGRIFELLLRANCIVTASLVMVRRSALMAVGGFDITQPYWADDWDLWMRLAQRGPFLFLLEDLVGYRRHGTNTSSTTSFAFTAGNLHALRNIGRLLVNDSSAALKVYRDSLYNALVAMGWQHRKKGQRGRAIACYLEALRLRPTALHLLARAVAIALLPAVVLRDPLRDTQSARGGGQRAPSI